MDPNFYAFMAHLYKTETVRSRYRTVYQLWPIVVGNDTPFVSDTVMGKIDTHFKDSELSESSKTNALEAFRNYTRFVGFWDNRALSVEPKIEEHGRRQSFHARTVTDSTNYVFALDGMYASLYHTIQKTMHRSAASDDKCLLVLLAIEFPMGNTVAPMASVRLVTDDNTAAVAYTAPDEFYIRRRANRTFEFVYPVRYNGPKRAKVTTIRPGTLECSSALNAILKKKTPGPLLDAGEDFKLKDIVLKVPFTTVQRSFLSSFLANQLFNKVFKMARIAAQLETSPDTDATANLARCLGINIGQDDPKYRLDAFKSVQRADRFHAFLESANAD